MYTTWCHYQLSDNRFLKLVLLLQPSKQVTVSIKTWSCGGAYSINKCVLDSFSQTLETGESRSIICWQRRWTGEVVVGAAAECQGKLAVTQSGQLEVTLPPREGGGGGLFAICEVSYYSTGYLLPCITQMEPGQWRIFVQSHCIYSFAGSFKLSVSNEGK